MSLKRSLPGIGEALAESVGSAIHVSVREQDGATRGMAFAVLLDEDMAPRLSRIQHPRPMPEGDPTPFVELAKELLDTNVSARFFLVLDRVEMDLRVLRREFEDLERKGGATDQTKARIEQLATAQRALRQWSNEPRRPLPTTFGPSVPAPFGFVVRPPLAGTIARALSTGEVSSFPNDPLHSPVTAAIELAAEAGHQMVPFSLRDDPTGAGRHAVYPGLSSKDPRFGPQIRKPASVAWMAEQGALDRDDLVVLEATVPVAANAEAFLARLLERMDPVTVVFDASTVHVGKASRLHAAFRRRPAESDLIEEIGRRIETEGEIDLGRYVEIVQSVAGRYGMDYFEAMEAFRIARGEDYLVTAGSPTP